LLPLRFVLDEADGGLRVVDDVGDLFGRAGGVDPSRGPSCHHRSDVEGDPLGPIEAEDRRRPAGLEAERHERAPGLLDLGAELFPARAPPDAALTDGIRRREGPSRGLLEKSLRNRVDRHCLTPFFVCGARGAPPKARYPKTGLAWRVIAFPRVPM